MSENKVCPYMSQPKKQVLCLREKCQLWIVSESSRGQGVILTRVTEVENMCAHEATAQLLLLLIAK